ncbi:cyclopropane fatty-acyl-phospholipid synthase-like methyltransferase [Saccharothrix carnea]|uniref:Cyclopropane fatty-acyl-phospholipid synthase-like methyltransferase n=1 Tax=Saccharothrix carnea TaxID=1280637 RepID=A0A2P8HD17_SACCR|nr:methyltransferase domain-containing protein [Saccharothrix carnea]PSL44107.1 cyclopropane fatty-acyl-phospholipid synthase-like methyltransferase [Saccharothrix carnea]
MTDTSALGAEVARMYERTTALVELIWGPNLHFGYWAGPDDTSDKGRAQERLTDLMIERVPLVPGQRLLDVGCGVGHPALRFARKTGADVVGVTIAPGQVAAATEAAREEGLRHRATFELADAAALPFPDDSFDGAWALESMPHMPDRAAVLSETARVLRPGSRLALTDVAQCGPLSEQQRHDLRERMLITAPPRPELLSLLGTAGFEVLEVVDITASTARTTELTRQALEGNAHEWSRRYGADTVEHMARVLDVYDDAVATGMEYLLITARLAAEAGRP